MQNSRWCKAIFIELDEYIGKFDKIKYLVLFHSEKLDRSLIEIDIL